MSIYFKLRGHSSAVWQVVLLSGALILGVLVATSQGGWSPLRTTLIAGALVVAGFAGGWVAHIPARGAAQPATAGPPAQVGAVTVDATDPNWTDTGLTVRKGQQLEISAFGLARSSARGTDVGPTGEPTAHPPSQSVVPAFPHLALLATVVRPGTELPLDARAGGRRVLDIGPHRSFTAPASGELLLGVNDTGTGNNRGWFGATVRR